MRKIGAVSSKEQGDLLGTYLLSKGMNNQIEESSDGSCAVWIHSDDNIPPAREILSDFVADPENPVYAEGADDAEKKQQESALKEERFRKNYHDRSKVFAGARIGVVTAFLLAVSILVTLLTGFGEELSLTNLLFLTHIDPVDGSYYVSLPEIRSGEVWRLVTPVFLHFNFLHLLFNMLWLSDLGSVLERRHGSWALLLFVLMVAIPSNVLQFAVSGPSFGGMSGVVYGLLGYLWIRAKTDPFYDLHLRPNTVVMMGIWFVLCLALPQLNVANVVHGVGLAVGAGAGYLSGVISKSQRFGR